MCLAAAAYCAIPTMGPALADDTTPAEKDATSLTMRFSPNARLQQPEKDLETFRAGEARHTGSSMKGSTPDAVS